MLEMKFAKLLSTLLYTTIIFSVGFSLILFYILSVNVDQKIQENALKKFEMQVIDTGN
jgi:hypothetical protein